MVYCRLLTVNEFANITRNGTGTGMRRKRSGPTSLLSCSPTFPKPGSATIAEGCLGGGCTIPILPVLEFQFNLETCLPPISWLSGTQMKVSIPRLQVFNLFYADVPETRERESMQFDGHFRPYQRRGRSQYRSTNHNHRFNSSLSDRNRRVGDCDRSPW